MHLRSRLGQGMVEYALILAVVVLVVIVALSAAGVNIGGKLSTVGGQITSGQSAPPVPPTPTPTPNLVGSPCSPPNGGTWKLNGAGNLVCTKS